MDTLVRLYETTNGRAWSANSGWLAPRDAAGCPGSSWAGLKVRSCQPLRMALQLDGAGLNGVLPTELGALEGAAAAVKLSDAASLSGTLPTSLGKLQQLKRLELYGLPRLSGTLPSELGMSTRLQWLKMDGLTSLSGTVPTQLGSLSRLIELRLSTASLSGVLPPMPKLQRSLLQLNMQHLHVSGTLPSVLPGWPCYWLRHGGMAVGRAAQVCHFETALRLDGNRISGTVPSDLRLGTGVAALNLSANRISGSLPEAILGYHRVDFSHNRLSGSLPSSAAGVRSLWSLRVTGNAAPLGMLGWQEDPVSEHRGIPIAGSLYKQSYHHELAAWLRTGPGGRHATTVLAEHATPSPVVSTLTTCCIHSCRGRGKCIDGSCRCNAGYHGLDCGLQRSHTSSGSIGACGNNQGATPLSIYVGDDGALLMGGILSASRGKWQRGGAECAGEPVATIDAHARGIYVAPDMLLLRLLKDGARRAASAACASAIWHPTFAYRVTGNIGSERINMAFEAGKMALRNASSSTPHIHVMVGDREVCHLGVPASLHKPGDVVLTHWGNEDCFVPAVNYVVLPPGSGFSKRALGPKRRPALWDVRDEALVTAAIAAYGTPGAASPPRKRALFFRGSTRVSSREHVPKGRCYVASSKRPRRCRKIYSMGIRQTVEKLIGSHPAVHFNRASSDTDPTSYHGLLRGYEFCLTAPGTGFGTRIVDMVASGCIPVVVRPGRLRLPFEPGLKYDGPDGFAVSVPMEGIPALPSLLANMSAEMIAQKRARLREIHRMFIWDETYGEAYEAVLEQIRAGLHRNPDRNVS